MKKIFPLLFMVSLFVSCIKNEVDSSDPSLENDRKISTKVVKVSALSGSESLNVACSLQNDMDLLMLMHLKYHDGKYSLDISESDAVDYGLEMSLYEKYIEIVSLLNE